MLTHIDNPSVSHAHTHTHTHSSPTPMTASARVQTPLWTVIVRSPSPDCSQKTLLLVATPSKRSVSLIF